MTEGLQLLTVFLVEFNQISKNTIQLSFSYKTTTSAMNKWSYKRGDLP